MCCTVDPIGYTFFGVFTPGVIAGLGVRWRETRQTRAPGRFARRIAPGFAGRLFPVPFFGSIAAISAYAWLTREDAAAGLFGAGLFFLRCAFWYGAARTRP